MIVLFTVRKTFTFSILKSQAVTEIGVLSRNPVKQIAVFLKVHDPKAIGLKRMAASSQFSEQITHLPRG
jgi:hypothetical protein